MNRYSEDTSTSSEDDTSTAEAGAVSTLTTADMCRRAVRKGVKVQRCTGCGYTSDRRANVTRHYRRIHVQLKKRRKCSLCGEVFETKWEFYEHCDEYHPNMRQSWYITTHVYKLKQTKAKSKLKSVSRSSKRVESRGEQVISPRVTRSTARLRSQKVVLDAVGPSTITAALFSSSGSSADEAAPKTSTESSSNSFSSEDDLKNNENAAPRIVKEVSHLPIKKRYMSERRILADITNYHVVVQKVNDPCDSNNNKMSDRDLYFSKLDEEQREYIGDINFDELDAMLQLRYMRRNI